jgi:hypothetical protein
MFVNFNILNQLGSPAINSNTFANRPAAGQTGRLFVSTDTFEIYRDNGTTWDLIGGPGSSTITGTGTATQVAYFTSSQAIGSSANLFWDNTSGFLGVATATPSARIEAVKTDGVGIYANFTTNAGSGSSTTALWAKNVTNSSGFAAVIEETTPNTTAGQYPLLIKHSLSSGTAGVGMGTGLHFQLPDDAGTFKTTQLTIETINAAAATYATRYRFNVQNNGSSTPVAYINATGLGIFTATPGAALDVHSTGTIAQFNTTSATGNTYIAFQRTGSGLWRIGDTYNGGNNFFELHNTVLGTDALEFEAATNKSTFQAQQTYTTGLARGNYFDYNLSVAAGGSFSSPNAITALGASLDLTLAGNATIPSGARSGLDAYNSIAFTGAGTLTHTQGTQIRAYSNLTAGWAFNGSATGTITHLAVLRALFPDNSGSAVNVTNNYALLLNDQTANTGTVTYTNRWGVYQEGTSDLNYMAANLLLGSTTNSGQKLQVTGTSNLNGTTTITSSATNTGGLIVTGGSNIGTPSATSAQIFVGSTGNRGSIAWDDNTGYLYIDNTYNNAAANIYIRTRTNGTPVNLITGLASGFVGIATTTPASVLNVLSTKTTALSTAADFLTLGATIDDNTAFNNVGIGGGIAFRAKLNAGGSQNVYGAIDAAKEDAASTDYRGALRFWTNQNATGVPLERMRITSAGLVGIGTSTPTGYGTTLQISSTISSDTSIVIGDGSGTTTNRYLAAKPGSAGNLFFGTDNGQIRFVTQLNPGTTIGNTRGLFTSGGNLLIGTTTDGGSKLLVNGDIYVSTLGSSIYFDTTSVKTIRQYVSGSFDFNIENYRGTTSKLVLSANNITLGSMTVVAMDLNTSNQKITFTNSIKTGAPTTGTAAEWKLGSRVAATVVLDTTQYIELDVGGTLYKLAIVT